MHCVVCSNLQSPFPLSPPPSQKKRRHLDETLNSDRQEAYDVISKLISEKGRGAYKNNFLTTKVREFKFQKGGQARVLFNKEYAFRLLESKDALVLEEDRKWMQSEQQKATPRLITTLDAVDSDQQYHFLEVWEAYEMDLSKYVSEVLPLSDLEAHKTVANALFSACLSLAEQFVQNRTSKRTWNADFKFPNLVIKRIPSVAVRFIDLSGKSINEPLDSRIGASTLRQDIHKQIKTPKTLACMIYFSTLLNQMNNDLSTNSFSILKTIFLQDDIQFWQNAGEPEIWWKLLKDSDFDFTSQYTRATIKKNTVQQDMLVKAQKLHDKPMPWNTPNLFEMQFSKQFNIFFYLGHDIRHIREDTYVEHATTKMSCWNSLWSELIDKDLTREIEKNIKTYKKKIEQKNDIEGLWLESKKVFYASAFFFWEAPIRESVCLLLSRKVLSMAWANLADSKLLDLDEDDALDVLEKDLGSGDEEEYYKKNKQSLERFKELQERYKTFNSFFEQRFKNKNKRVVLLKSFNQLYNESLWVAFLNEQNWTGKNR